MSIRLLLTLALLTGSALWAADAAYTPMDVKTGQWETTQTTDMSGAPPIPAELLDRLTPEQRAKMEAAMKARAAQGAQTKTYKSCLRKEDLERPEPLFRDDTQRACKTTLVSSSRLKAEYRVDCSQTQMKVSGTGSFEALNSENVKFNSKMTATDGARAMTATVSSTSKWLGPACTESK